MRVQQIRDGIRIARRTFTPDARSLNVDYPESAQLALSAAMHRKIARASGRTKMEAKRTPRIPRMTTRRKPQVVLVRDFTGRPLLYGER
jgi:hypothetical protein